MDLTLNKTYLQLAEELEERKCKECHGMGHCDDADFEDIYYRSWVCPTWVCPGCNGSGLLPIEDYQ